MVNCLSVRLATGLQNILTGAKLVAVVIIVIACFVKLGQGNFLVMSKQTVSERLCFNQLL